MWAGDAEPGGVRAAARGGVPGGAAGVPARAGPVAQHGAGHHGRRGAGGAVAPHCPHLAQHVVMRPDQPAAACGSAARARGAAPGGQLAVRAAARPGVHAPPARGQHRAEQAASAAGRAAGRDRAGGAGAVLGAGGGHARLCQPHRAAAPPGAAAGQGRDVRLPRGAQPHAAGQARGAERGDAGHRHCGVTGRAGGCGECGFVTVHNIDAAGRQVVGVPAFRQGHVVHEPGLLTGAGAGVWNNSGIAMCCHADNAALGRVLLVT
mmetsp:Transcript_8685/g.21510  ORF Transcript_8685/g.21510 Transcript_8685/m.21510 type:complete len:264 (+) Transcript_8685:1285-2076(+)